jgi:LCP family protein required for cell wall assembly
VDDPGTAAPPAGYPGPDDPEATDPGVGMPPVEGAAARFRRARKVLLIGVAALAVLIVGTGTAAYLVARHDLSSMRRIGNPFASIPASQRPPLPTGPAAKDVTFLIGGLDTQSPVPATGTYAASSMRGRTDTLMLVHLIAGGRGAYAVSIPPDSWVPIPGHGAGKANRAYAVGGPALTIRTIERLTNVRVDHFAIIAWDGFRAVTNALGGVTVNVPVTTYDPASRVTWTAGSHHLDGTQALLYVKDRHGPPNGDVPVEQRQQEYLRAMFQQLRQAGTLANPLSAGSVMHALTSAVSVDSTLTVTAMLHLALSMRGLDTSRIVFATAPYLGTGTAHGQSVVRLNQSVGRPFWHAFEYDSLPAFLHKHHLHRFGASAP